MVVIGFVIGAGDISETKDTCCSGEDISLFLNTHIVACNHLKLQFQGILCPLLTSMDTRHIHGTHAYIHTHKKHSYT